MQDQTQNEPANKQYFDIKPFSEPSATSRPVINGNPIQDDPMVSPTVLGNAIEGVGSAAPKYVMVEDNTMNGALNRVDEQEFADKNMVAPGGMAAAAAQTSDAASIDTPLDTSAVSSKLPNPNIEKLGEPVNALEASQLENVSTSTAPELQAAIDQNIKDAETHPDAAVTEHPSQQPLPQPSEHLGQQPPPQVPVGQLNDQVPINNEQLVSQHVISKNPTSMKDKINIKTIIGIIILICIVAGAIVVYKFKTGK